jgi:16S rRNA G966 N2-methylase RsmD
MWYEFHPYWRTRDCDSIRRCISKFSKEGETVLDSFMGAGTVIIESLLSKRRATGSDLNPFSVFLTKSMVERADLDELRAAFSKSKDGAGSGPGWFPEKIPISVGGKMKNAGIGEFVSEGNLAALSALYESIRATEASESTVNSLKLCFTSALTRIVPGIAGDRLVLGAGPLKGSADVVGLFEHEFWKYYGIKERMNRLADGSGCRLAVSDASKLDFLETGSIDYAFIDPPYSVPYLNLSSLWCSWLGLQIDFADEMMLAKDGFEERLGAAVREIARVLRDGKCFTLNYVDKRPGIRDAATGIIKDAGFSEAGTEAKPGAGECLVTFRKG